MSGCVATQSLVCLQSAGSVCMRRRGSARGIVIPPFLLLLALATFRLASPCSPARPQALTAPHNNLGPDAAPALSVSLPQRGPRAVLSQPGGGCARRSPAPERRHQCCGGARPLLCSSCPCHRPGPEQRRGRPPGHHQCGQLHQHQVRDESPALPPPAPVPVRRQLPQPAPDSGAPPPTVVSGSRTPPPAPRPAPLLPCIQVARVDG